MTEDFYKTQFEKHGISIVTPNGQEQDYIHNKLFSKIEIGIFKESTKEGFLKIIEQMKNENQIEGVILGCTELPLILTEPKFNIPFINTTKIHCDSILEYCLK